MSLPWPIKDIVFRQSDRYKVLLACQSAVRNVGQKVLAYSATGPKYHLYLIYGEVIPVIRWYEKFTRKDLKVERIIEDRTLKVYVWYEG